MSTTTNPSKPETAPELHEAGIGVRGKLAAAWASYMFFYIYVDLLHFYKPGVIEDIQAGVVFEFDISQTFVTSALVIVGVPALMITLSVALAARMSRMLNIVVAAICIPIAAFNVVGESWVYFYGLGVAVEVGLLAFILRAAWTWPTRINSGSAA